MDERHGQQNRQQDGQSDGHHHHVVRQILVVAEQQLRIHMSYEVIEQACVRGVGGGVGWGRGVEGEKSLRLGDGSQVTRGPTVEGEVAEDGGDEVQQHAEADADVGHVLHFAFGRSERHQEMDIQSRRGQTRAC